MSADCAIGIDVGGTKISACVVERGRIVSEVAVAPTPASEGPDAVLEVAAALAHRVAASVSATPIACGLGCGGTFDLDGTVSASTDLLAGWMGTEVAREVEARLGLPTVAINDGHAAGFGEAWHGAARDATRTILIALGTGIGGAFVVGDRVLRGRNGSAGSLGHVTVRASGIRVCSCGAINHLEPFASGPGIEETYAELTGQTVPARAIGDLARAGHEAAMAAISATIDVLVPAITTASIVFEPDLIVLGGGASGLGDLLREPLEDEGNQSLRGFTTAPRVSIAHLRNEAAMVGAASLAARVSRGSPLDSFFI